MGVPLSTLRTEVRQRADMTDSDFVTDSELNNYINKAWAELYDILVTTYEDYFTEGPNSFTLAAGESTYDLPDDFYKLRGVDFKTGGQNEFSTLYPFTFKERNEQTSGLRRWPFGLADIRYRLVKNTLRFIPEDSAQGDYQLWYIPAANTLSDDADEMDGVNGWEDYVVVSATIRCLEKEETDTVNLRNELRMLKTRIEDSAANRDAGQPERIEDVNTSIYRPGYWDWD